jgi:hypothetical protein
VEEKKKKKKKKKKKRTRSTVSVDTTTISSDVERPSTLMMKRARQVANRNCSSFCGDTSQGSVAGKTCGGDALPDVEDSRAPQVEHRHGGRPWVAQEDEESPA